MNDNKELDVVCMSLAEAHDELNDVDHKRKDHSQSDAQDMEKRVLDAIEGALTFMNKEVRL